MKRKFDVYDYVIFFIILLISIFIGIFFGLQLNEKLSEFFKKKFKCFNKKKAKVVDIELELKEKNEDKIENNNDETDRTKTLNYLTANQSMGAFPIALSLLSTFFSSSSLLGFPAEVYQYGIQYWVIIFGIIFDPLIGAFATGPFFQKLKVVSIFEFLKMRYNSEAARLLGVTLYLIRTLIAMGIVIFGPATSLNSLTDLSTELAIGLIGVIATFYTTIGGLKAVVWTDAFQTIIMFSGLIAVIIKGIIDVGGFDNLWQINTDGGRINFFNFDPNPMLRQSFWSLTIGGAVSWSMSYTIDQQMIQRYQAAKSKKTAQTALLLNIPGIIFLISLCCFSGLVLYANYSTCDPLSDTINSGINNPNQLLPYFVMEKFYNVPFVPGLFLASIFCASLSSVSSGLTSMSACIWRDYLMRFEKFKRFNDYQSSITTKVIVLICGSICTGFGFLISILGSNLLQISSTINGALQAPLIGIFFMSSMIPILNVYGLYAGALSGFGIGCWLSIGSFVVNPKYPRLVVSTETCSNETTGLSYINNLIPIPLNGEATNLSGFDKVYSVSYMWLSTIGVLTTVIIGVLVSLITMKFVKTHKPDDNVILYKSLFRKNKNKDNTVKE